MTSLFNCLAPNLPNITHFQAFLGNVNCKTNLIKGREKGQDAKSLLCSLQKGGAPRVRGQGLVEMEARPLLLFQQFQGISSMDPTAASVTPLSLLPCLPLLCQHKKLT